MNIAVIGASGNLGHELVRQECVPVQANILDVEAMRAELRQIRPEVVINCAAISAERSLDDETNTRLVNTRGPANILRAFEGRVIHISTDFVFDGEQGNYIEEDAPNPINYFGITKWGGEIHCNILGDGRCCVVRTSWLYGGYKQNDLLTMIVKSLRKNEPLAMAISLHSNPTYIPHLAEALLKLCKKVDMPPILHITGNETVTRYQFAREIASVWHLPPMIVPSDVFIEKSPIKRPKNSGLNTKKAKNLGLPIYSLFKGLCDFNAAYTSA